MPDHFGTLCIKGLRTVLYPFAEAHYGPIQAPKMDLFTEIVNSYVLKKVEKSIMDKLLPAVGCIMTNIFLVFTTLFQDPSGGCFCVIFTKKASFTFIN